MTHPCPTWCQLWPGHGLPDEIGLGRTHDRLVGKYLTTLGHPVTLELRTLETIDDGRARMDAPFASIYDGAGLEEMSSRDLRTLAQLFVDAADQLDQLGTAVTRAHLSIVTGSGR